MNCVRAVVVSLLLLACAPAAAGDFATIDDTQLDLVTRGLEAHNAGDYDRAAELFEAALLVKELNVVYLNLGRTLQRGGACGAADEAFDKALTAPAVQNPSAAEVKQAAEKYRAELQRQCPGEATLSCEDGRVTVDGEPAICGTTVTLEPGTHTARFSNGDGATQMEFEVIGLTTVTVELTVATTTLLPPDDPSPVRTMTVVGWGLVGAGAVGVLTGAWYTSRAGDVEDEIAAEGRRETVNANRARDLLDEGDEVETGQALAYGFGVAALLTGTVLLVLDTDAEQVTVAPVPGGATVGITTRW